MDNNSQDTEEFTGLEAFVYDTLMGVALVLSWLMTGICFLLQSRLSEKNDFPLRSRKDFRQVGLQLQPIDKSGLLIAIAVVIAVVVVIVFLRPNPFP